MFKTLKDWLAFGKLEGPGSTHQAYRPQEAMKLKAAMRSTNYATMTPQEQCGKKINDWEF